MATISIADNDARVQYTQAITGNSTSLTIDFPFFSLDDIKVIVTNSSGVDITFSGGSGYTRGTGTGTFAVTGTAVDDGFSGGTLTLNESYDNTNTVTIFREITVARTSDFPTAGPFNIASLNTEFDKLTAIVQQNNNNFARTIKLNESDAAANLTVPNATTRPNKYLGFDGSGNLAALSGTGATIGTIETANIANDAIDQSKIANNAVGSSQIIDNSVTASELNISGNGSSGQAITSDGDGSFSYTNLSFPGRLINIQSFTSSGTYTPNASASSAVVYVQGAGGGGGGADSDSNTSQGGVGSGGNGGGFIQSIIIDVSAGSYSSTITIGSGGAGGAGDASGSAGGNTVYNDGTISLTAKGGAGGTSFSDSTAASVSRSSATQANTVSSASHCVLNIGTNPAENGIIVETAGGNNLGSGGKGGNSFFGYGGRGGISVSSSSTTEYSGDNGVGFGSGGGGAAVRGAVSGGSYPAGDGNNGVVMIYEYS